MKRCPQCYRVEADEALKFCRVDGATLVAPLASESESATISLSGPRSVEEINTGQINNAPSIAVLPFVNMSADPENEYFCDGLAEELLNALAKIDELNVAARTSSFSFKGKTANVDQIGQTLHVKTILEGSVRRAGSRLRITVQLVNVADGYHLWSERYDRELQDIFDVQDEITLAVVKALKVKLLGSEKETVLKRYTNNPEAHQLYLRGRFFFFKRTPEGFRKAIECFEQAIAIDPDYALAFSGLADRYTFLGFYEVVAPADSKDKARAAAFRALELDDTLAETHSSVAFYYLTHEWNFSAAEEHFAKARALNPKYPFAHHLHSSNLLLLGLQEQAFAAEAHAIELEPFNVIFNAALSWWYYLACRNNDAVAQALKTIDIAPNHFFARWVLGLAYGLQGMHQEAVLSLQQALKTGGFEQGVRGDLGRTFAISGLVEEAREVLAGLREQAETEYVSAINMAKIHAGLGERELFFEWLDKAFEERAVRLPWFIIDPALDDFRDDPRFVDLVKRIGLPG